MVVLNTNLYYDQDNETAGEDDPGGQFEWLEETLANASRADEMVLKEVNNRPLWRAGAVPSLQSQQAGAPWCSLQPFGRSTSRGTSHLASSRRNEASPGSGAALTNDT